MTLLQSWKESLAFFEFEKLKAVALKIYVSLAPVYLLWFERAKWFLLLHGVVIFFAPWELQVFTLGLPVFILYGVVKDVLDRVPQAVNRKRYLRHGLLLAVVVFIIVTLVSLNLSHAALENFNRLGSFFVITTYSFFSMFPPCVFFMLFFLDRTATVRALLQSLYDACRICIYQLPVVVASYLVLVLCSGILRALFGIIFSIPIFFVMAQGFSQSLYVITYMGLFSLVVSVPFFVCSLGVVYKKLIGE